MTNCTPSSFPLSFSFPLQLEYFGWPAALLLFALLATPILLLGMWSLNGLGPVRKWVAIAMRLAVLFLFILILGGARWERVNKLVEVLVLRDISESTSLVKAGGNRSLHESLDEWMRRLGSQDNATKTAKLADDRLGVISFHTSALIDAMPSADPVLDARPIREIGNGTDIASAIQLGLATFGRDSMRRMLLISDGNHNSGDLDAAINAAVAQGVQIDVAPLYYNVENEVLMERFVAPAQKRENEPFTIDVVLRSTNPHPVTGRMTVLHQGQPMDLDPYTEGIQATRPITLKPGANVERIRVPALAEAGVHHFKATFESDDESGGDVTADVRTDTLLANNTAETFTFVRGRGKVLYIDNVADGRGDILRQALESEGLELETRHDPARFPNSIIELQNYDAVVLANVPRGHGGISEEQQKMLATYVHDMGGGLVMIGGPDTFGAGGWQGSRLEEVLPVNMDIPAQRQIPKGALVLVMHSCEMPEGNYWGEQCAIKASETLSERDEIGVISYAWSAGSSNWDFPLQIKGDGSRVIAAIKRMQLGDMPSFEDSMNLALFGRNNVGGLIRSDARQKHVIVISDGDPVRPSNGLIQAYRDAKVSISTVSVYPHDLSDRGLPPTMRLMADATGGRAYGPINNNFNQLPQIFIKEARIVRRSLIHEPSEGIPLKQNLAASEMMKGLENVQLPSLAGMVLTSRKNEPQVEMPISAGAANDPVFAHWQTGLGKSAVFTGDAHNRWSARWVPAPFFSKFWAQVVRGVARPPMSTDFDVQTAQIDAGTGRITVEAIGKDNRFLSFLNIRGMVVGPDLTPREVRLVQTAPGTYTADFDARDAGNYAVVLSYSGPRGEQGYIPSGMSISASPELRDLSSNHILLQRIAEQTGGRVLEPFDTTVRIFDREGLRMTSSPLPIWDILLPILLGLIIMDVATRRIAWDWLATKRMAATAAEKIRAFTVVRKVESEATLDALRRVRDEVAEQKFKTMEQTPGAPAAPPDRSAKFEAEGVEGDIGDLVGGATATPSSQAPKKDDTKTDASEQQDHTSSLLQAKRRAQQQIKQKEQGE